MQRQRVRGLSAQALLMPKHYHSHYPRSTWWSKYYCKNCYCQSHRLAAGHCPVVHDCEEPVYYRKPPKARLANTSLWQRIKARLTYKREISEREPDAPT